MGFAAGIAGAGSAIGGLFGGKKSKQEKQLMSQQLQIAKQQQDQANEQFGIAKGYLPQFNQALQKAMGSYQFGQDYYKQIAGGGEGALNALLGPQRSEFNRAYQQQVQNIGTQGPRGGGTNARLAELDSQRQGQLIDIALQARPQAVQQYTALGQNIENIGQQYGQMSLGYLGQGNQQLQGAGSQIASLLGTEQNAINRRNESLSGLGQGLGNIFTAIGKKRGWF